MFANRFVVVVLAISLICCLGCVPDVAWLPDSSGIVYTVTDWPFMETEDKKKDHFTRLLHFDIKTQKEREVFRVGSNTLKTAIRPTSGHIALIEFEQKLDSTTMQVILIDLQGQVIHRSQVFPWRKPIDDWFASNAFQLFWSVNGNDLLICDSEMAVYHFPSKKLTRLGLLYPMAFGNTPIIPDGSGFLASNANDTLYRVDWEGKKTKIHVDPQLLVGRPGTYIYSADAYCWSRWKGSNAISLWRGKQATVDTSNNKVTVQDVDDSVWSFQGKEVLQYYQFPDTKVSIVVTFVRSIRDFNDAGVQSCAVEVHGMAGNRSRIIAKETAHCTISPSPNQKYVTLRFMNQTDHTVSPFEKLIIFDSGGEVVAQSSIARNKSRK